ncbi:MULTISPECIES: helix-turn-helix domain-containing protein [Streptomyces]|uniref:helix-turn-helix domain-containing protein n=1 Tax=Streptomyces TaxID=1883 RepID=UPI0019A694C7|nr:MULTISPECIES: helix-turn-helix transcriptional regulator [Streptomyces]GGS92113.1 transcriptional regulator [Streptomyces toxytricini]
MSAQGDGGGEVAECAALLRELKERTDRSYASLARRLGMNTSTLHRYCAGDAVPVDFAPLERFAVLCGATSEQRLELHRRWLLAVAARQRSRPALRPDTAAAEPDGEPVVGTGPAGGEAAVVVPVQRRRPWYRRRGPVAGLAAVFTVFATLGALAALSVLPEGRRVPADASASQVGGPVVEGSKGLGASPGPDGGPASEPAEAAESAAGPGEPQGEAGASRPAGVPSAPPSEALPFTWVVDSHGWEFDCGHHYVITEAPGRVPPPPAPQDGMPWAAAQGAVHGGETSVRLSVQGRSDTAVVLEALRVRVVGRAGPVRGNAYAMGQGCGGAITPRYFAVDLDKDRPLARAVAGNDSGTPIPAVSMPYRVSAKEPEVLLVTAGTKACDCRWYLELDWSSQGRKGTVRIDDEGRPFRTSAIAGLPRYEYDTLGRRWAPTG